MEKKSDKVEFNPTALISFILILMSGLLFQLFQVSILGQSFNKFTMFDYILLFLTAPLDSNIFNVILSILLITTFLTILFLYFLNGFGLIHNKSSGSASFLTFIYLMIGSIMYKVLSQESINFMGFNLSNTSLGMGLYFPPIVGIAYLLFYRQINSAFKF